ncbi:MAG: hypothetical protein ABEJ77_01225 [Halanaeroarchaeum sp.]
MHVTRSDVTAVHDWALDREAVVVPLANDVRERLGAVFETDVDPVSTEAYAGAIDDVFADADRALNAATLILLLRELDVAADYPGFVVDELLGRELAAIVGGEQPRRLLAEATFHVADLHSHADGPAGLDDVDAALAAGVQTRVPGWDWTETDGLEKR